MSNPQAIADFQAARELYLARSFAEARDAMQRYRQAVDYGLFERSDRRGIQDPEITVVIVSYQASQALLDCLDSVFRQCGPRFEVIVVDNGGNQSIHSELAKLPLLWIKPPVNLLPSEGRNIGAYFAYSDVLVFLDDDALMASGYLAQACRALEDDGIIALRGRILGKNPSPKANLPQQYDLGEISCPAELNLEGNCVIRRSAYITLKGFDPLLFGHEGKELTRRCRARYPERRILYWPTLMIRHDYAQAGRLAAKRERQAIAKDYLQYLKEHPVNAGISILVRAGDDLSAASDFLESLVKHNTYKPVEVLLWAKDSQQALAMSGAYLAKLFVRVLPASTSSLSRIGGQARYENILIIDLPARIETDVLSLWMRNQKADLNNALLCIKQKIAALADAAINLPLTQLAGKLGQSISKPASPCLAPSKKPPLPPKPQAKPVPAASKVQPIPEIEKKIRQTEEQIQQLEAQLTQTDVDIADLESRYLPLLDNTSEKQALKDQLEDKVLTSCRLLIELKDAQDNLHELRIRSLCGA